MNSTLNNGVFAVATTPYASNGEQNLEALDQGINRAIDAGVTGLLLLGATGEALALTPDERREQVAHAVSTIDGRANVVVGCMGYTPQEVLEQIKTAAELGAQAAMITPPYYGGLEPEVAIEALRQVMVESPLPILVYNNPHSTGVDLSPEHLATLVDTGTFWAVKETSGEALRVRELRAALDAEGEQGTKVEVFVGADGIALEGFTQGATGWVAASAWLLPKECQKLMEAVQAKDWAHAVHVWNALAKPLGLIESSPAFISLLKKSLSRELVEQGPVRAPLPAATEEAVEELAEALQALKEIE